MDYSFKRLCLYLILVSALARRNTFNNHSIRAIKSQRTYAEVGRQVQPTKASAIHSSLSGYTPPHFVHCLQYQRNSSALIPHVRHSLTTASKSGSRGSRICRPSSFPLRHIGIIAIPVVSMIVGMEGLKRHFVSHHPRGNKKEKKCETKASMPTKLALASSAAAHSVKCWKRKDDEEPPYCRWSWSWWFTKTEPRLRHGRRHWGENWRCVGAGADGRSSSQMRHRWSRCWEPKLDIRRRDRGWAHQGNHGGGGLSFCSSMIIR